VLIRLEILDDKMPGACFVHVNTYMFNITTSLCVD
jgi:hypothetical protein